MNLSELNSRFSIPNVVKFDAGNGALSRAVISGPQSQGEVYLLGAHVTQFQPKGQKPVLWMSSRSNFVVGKAIRGGVPICFPWFGPKADDSTAPLHGHARLSEWTVQSVTQRADGAPVLVLNIELLGQYAVKHTITFGSKLEMALEVKNISAAPVQFEEALHTYIPVNDIRQTKVSGLENTRFISKVHNGLIMDQGDGPIAFTGETDRVYMNTTATCIVHDPGWGRKIVIEKTNSNSTVVWNPWIDKAKAMPDFPDEEWTGMLCVETCNVKDNAIALQPGQTHVMRAIIGVG